MNNLKKTIAVLITSSTLCAGTNVSVYSVPFGSLGEVSASNFRAFEKRLENVPSSNFSIQEKDTVMTGDGIVVLFEDKNAAVENYNKLLAAVYAYSKTVPGVNTETVKQAVEVLSIKRMLGE